MTLSPRRSAFRVDVINRGLDIQRTQPMVEFGDYVATVATTFEAGMLVDLDSNGNVIKSVGAAPFGWAKYNKSTSFYATVIGEYIQLNGVVATSLDHANLRTAAGGVAGIRVGTAVMGGTTYTEGGGNDYVVNYTNGTVTRSGASTIVDGGYVYVNYLYAMTAQELADDGHNFWNFDDDVTVQGGKITVIHGPGSIIYTAQYDTHQTWAINDAVTAGVSGDSLSGLVTKGGAGLAVGTVIQVPTVADPFLGIKSAI